MTSVDTNVIVRFLTRDDEPQFQKSAKIFSQSRQILIVDTVVQETEWVLRKGYGFEPGEICNSLLKLFGMPNVFLENPLRTVQAIRWHIEGMDFSDALHLARSQGATAFATFDKKFRKTGRRLTNLELIEP